MKIKNRSRKELFLMDVVFFLSAFSLFGVFRPDYVVMAVFFLIVPYLIFTNRKILFNHFLLSSVMAILWVMFAQDIYGYNYGFIAVMGIDLFPVFSWSIGLLTVYSLYRQHRYFPESWGFAKHLVLFTFIYLVLLIAVETISYHYFGIRITTAVYPGLPICDCIHAPTWMKAVYMMFGSVFFTLAYLLGIESPHVKSWRGR